MKKYALLSIAAAFALCAGPAFAGRLTSSSASDEREANNSVFVEGGGAGLLYSINYERIFERDYGLRVGFGYVGLSATASSGGTTSTASASFITVPVMFNYLGISSGNHALELGAGGTAVFFSGSGSSGIVAGSASGMVPLGTLVVGYRRQPADGGFMFRIGVEALIGKGLALSNPDPNSIGVVPWAYMSLGFSL